MQKASNLKGEIEPIKVLKARVYQISKANILIRAASDGNRNYFYGINYITIEEMAKMFTIEDIPENIIFEDKFSRLIIDILWERDDIILENQKV